MRRTILILFLLFPFFTVPSYADDAQADLSRRVERLELQHRESEVITKRLNTLQDLLFDHDRILNDARHVQKRADTQILDRRVQRLEYQQEISNAEQDKKLHHLETTIKDHHDAVVRESDRLHDRADTQLSWLAWGLGILTFLAALGAMVVGFSMSSKLSQAREEHEKCANLRVEIEEAKNEIDTIHKEILTRRTDISEMADEIKTKKNEILSNIVTPETLKRSENYMKTKEAQAALFSQAMIHTKEEKFNAALTLWQDYLEYDKDNAKALFYAALSAQSLANTSREKHRRSDLLKQADEWYQLSDTLAPNMVNLLFNWGNLLTERGEIISGMEQHRLWDQAEEKYRRAVETDPQHVSAWTNWGALLTIRGQNTTGEEQQKFWDQANDKYCRATETDPQHVSAWTNWGVLLTIRGQNASGEGQQKFWEEAENKYRIALNIDESRSNTIFSLACLYALRKDVTESLKWLEKWFAADTEASTVKIDNDSDFDAIRDEPEFKAFLARHRKEPPLDEE